jgi:hypothetical protein
MIIYTIESDATRERARQTIKQQTALNEKLKCSVPGCEVHRRGISQFCKAHQYFHQNRGHPLLRLPVGDERRQMLVEGEKMLTWLAEKHGRERVDAWLKSAARQAISPASMALPPRKIQRQMTQRTRAGVILAHFLHKRRGDPLDIVKLYLSAELFTWRRDQVFGPRIRNGFTNRVVGQMVAGWAKVEQEREVYQVRVEKQPSWANQEYRSYEEVVKVRDKYKPQKSVYKMLGKMVREILVDHSLLHTVKEYYDKLHPEDTSSIEH